MAHRNSTFQSDWLDPAINPEWAKWLRRGRLDSEAHCLFCRKSFNTASMGRAAITSHSKSEKHRKAVTAVDQLKIEFFTRSRPASTAVSLSSSDSGESSTNSAALITIEADAATASSSVQRRNPFLVKEQCTRGEIIAALNCVDKHYSYNSFRDFSAILQAMVPDSQIAKGMTLSYTKLSYIIAFGLAPYFKKNVIQQLSSAESYVICFDEAMNKIAQKGQMDVLVEFWDEEANRITIRYLTSVFLGHAKATDLFQKFKEAVGVLDMKKIEQICMDGPNVNLKFLRDFKTSYEIDPNDPTLLEIGTCSLHIVHGAFQFGHKATEWQLNSVLAAMYYLFKDTPVRRHDFLDLTGSSILAKKFCPHRWVENADVVDRALSVLPNFRTYVATVPTKPAVSSFEKLEKAFQDQFLIWKLEFFKSIALQLQPFLTKFQSPKPMAPFLFDELFQVHKSILRRFIKDSVLAKADTAKKLLAIPMNDPKSPNFRPVEGVDIGFAANKYLPTKASDLQRYNFYAQCQKFLVQTVSKLAERSPFKFGLVRGLSSLKPATIISASSSAQNRFALCLKSLYEANRILSSEADAAKCQFETLSTSASLLLKLKGFQENSDRLDEFWHSVLGDDSAFDILWKCTKILLLILPGNAAVERGFSVNENLLVENLQEQSLIAQRLVYDSIKNAGGVLKVNIDEDMIKSVHSSSARYKEALEDRRKEIDAEKQDAINRKRNADAIKEIEAKRRKLEEQYKMESNALSLQLAELKKV